MRENPKARQTDGDRERRSVRLTEEKYISREFFNNCIGFKKYHQSSSTGKWLKAYLVAGGGLREEEEFSKEFRVGGSNFDPTDETQGGRQVRRQMRL